MLPPHDQSTMFEKLHQTGGNSVPPGLSTAGLSSAGLSSDRLPDGLSLDGLSPDGLSRTAALSAGPAGLDAGADLADQTRSVLAAYRELTADLTPD
jgi:hypothetical protein